MTRAAAVAFLNRLRPLTASTKRSVPSSSKGVACTISPSSLAIGRPRCARWSAGFVPKCTLARPPPLFGPPSLGRPQRQPQVPTPAIPETTVVADARTLSLAPGRRLRTRVAGVFLFLPWWARVRFEQLVSHASSPGSAMVPATRALLSVLVLKLLDKARRSHLHDLNFDAAVGLCAGLKVPPQEILRDRLRLSHHTRPSAQVTLGLDRRHGAFVVSARQPLRPGLSPDPVSGRCHRAGPALPAQAWQSRDPCAALLRARAREPSRMLGQRASHTA